MCYHRVISLKMLELKTEEPMIRLQSDLGLHCLHRLICRTSSDNLG